MKVYKQPYVDRIQSILKITDVTETKIGLSFDAELVYNISKATGLKSNKKRHIKKRFKKFFNYAMKEILNEWKKESSDDSREIQGTKSS